MIRVTRHSLHMRYEGIDEMRNAQAEEVKSYRSRTGSPETLDTFCDITHESIAYSSHTRLFETSASFIVCQRCSPLTLVPVLAAWLAREVDNSLVCRI